MQFLYVVNIMEWAKEIRKAITKYKFGKWINEKGYRKSGLPDSKIHICGDY
jgi:hypothetical protein